VISSLKDPSTNSLHLLSRIIVLLDGFCNNDFYDHDSIEKIVEKSNLEFVRTKWMSISEDVESAYEPLTSRFRILARINRILNPSLIIACLFLTLSIIVEFIVGVLFKIKLGISLSNSLHLCILIILLAFGVIITRNSLKKEMSEIQRKYPDRFKKIIQTVQELISYFTRQVNLLDENPSDYRLSLHQTDYHGIMIYQMEKLLSGDHKMVKPSFMDLLISDAKRSVDIIDSLDPFNVLISLSKLSSKVQVRLMVSDRIEWTRLFRKKCEELSKMKLSLTVKKGHFDETQNRYIIVDGEIWASGPSLSPGNKFSTFVEIKNISIQRSIVKMFSEKWKKGVVPP